MTIKKDFDLISDLSESVQWNHNNHYHGYLLEYVPYKCKKALDIGCGTGDFSRVLAGKSHYVTAVDLSTKMIQTAKKKSKRINNILFENKDILDATFDPETFDCIVSIATLHHVPYEEALEKAKKWLKNGGVLIILDLYEAENLIDYLYSAIACPLNFAFNILKNKRIRNNSIERKLWNEHILHDEYMTISNIKKTALRILPNASIHRHLFWRYSLIWRKEGNG